MQRTAIRKAQPTAGDVHVNTPLTNVSTSFAQSADSFIADRAFPVVPVSKQSDIYFEYDRSTWLVGGAEKRAPSTQSAGSGYTVSEATYRCDVWALHKDVDDHVRANSDVPLAPDADATRWVTENMLITKEQQWAADHFVTGKWTSELAGNATASSTQFIFWDRSDSVPIQDIRAAKTTMQALTGKRPNRLVVTRDVWNVLQDNQEIVDRIGTGATTGQPALVTRNLVAQILELDEILVGEAIANTAQEGATESTGFIMADNALLVHTPSSPGLMTPSAGYTFQWQGLMGAGSMGTRIKRFRLDKEGAERIEGEEAYDHKLVSADLGFFFLNCIT